MVIPNNGIVDISEIGSTDPTALLCNTDRPPSGANSGGDWFAPDGDRVGINPPVPGFTRNRDPMVVRLIRTASKTPEEGIYHCFIKDDMGKQQTVYVGLYNSGGGNV